MDPAKIFSSPGWDIILSYLSLADLENVSQSNSKLKKIVGSYLDRGNTLTINRDTLWDHPIATRKGLYIRYGSRATNVVIDEVYPCDIGPLFDCFPKIRELTMKNVTINRRWVFEIHTSLITTLRIINPQVRLINLNKFKNLATLILQECSKVHSRFNLECRLLVKLTVDLYARVQYDELPRLQHLKINQSVDPKHREAIEALNLETVDVHYFDVPTEDTPIKRLNEDCFLYLRGFLSTNDWISLRDTLWCLQELKIPKFTVNKETMKRRPLPLYRSFYARIGPFITALEVVEISSDDVCELLPLFVNLNDLTLQNDPYESSEKLRNVFKLIPKGLRSFHYGNNLNEDHQLPQPEFTDLMRRLNPTLQTLFIREMYDKSTQSLMELQNIRDFGCDVLSVAEFCYCKQEFIVSRENEAFVFFLKLNQAHMVRLSVRTCLPSENAQLWSTIVEMQNLETLEIHSKLTFPNLQLFHMQLPKLRKLSLVGFHCVRQFLVSLDGSPLIELIVSEDSRQFCLSEILRFQQLRKLKCHWLSNENLLLLIKGLPQLFELVITKLDTPDDIMRDIITYLRQANRRLKLSYCENRTVFMDF